MDDFLLSRELRSVAANEGRQTARVLQWAAPRSLPGLVGGNQASTGSGDSIEFHDQREYQPGDDPRHVNWQGYARNDRFTMKLFRADVSPLIDIVVDTSASMVMDAVKARRTLAVLTCLTTLALNAGRAVRVYAWNGSRCNRCETHAIIDGLEPEFSRQEKPPDLLPVPWRPRSFRVLITDGLFEGNPHRWLRPLSIQSTMGYAVLIQSKAEAAPSWEGMVRLEDVEGVGDTTLTVDSNLMALYHKSYQAHFAQIRQSAAQLALRVARVDVDAPLLQALTGEPLSQGLISIRA